MPKRSSSRASTGAGLRYTGKGFVNNVPARDLSEDEVLQHGGYDLLIKSGCYEDIKQDEAVTDMPAEEMSNG